MRKMRLRGTSRLLVTKMGIKHRATNFQSPCLVAPEIGKFLTYPSSSPSIKKNNNKTHYKQHAIQSQTNQTIFNSLSEGIANQSYSLFIKKKKWNCADNPKDRQLQYWGRIFLCNLIPQTKLCFSITKRKDKFSNILRQPQVHRWNQDKNHCSEKKTK